MPKCGTSDLYERLKRHPSIVMPKRKEVRWFTRGEFTKESMTREGRFPDPYKDELQVTIGDNRQDSMLLGSSTSIYSFTNNFIVCPIQIRSLEV